MGTEDGNQQLVELLEDADILDLTNIGDKIGNIQTEILVEDIVSEFPPSVIVFSGKKMANEFGQIKETLEEEGYRVDYVYTRRSNQIEVPYQAVAYLQDEQII